ncbi:2-polyprenyl-6-methoxyphenol hydroxylase [Streptomyces sp. WMMB 714]|jgi:2-polyprenyl-6-methoxyphenol hydroxylase-like FAD-dependent oxidoreductase|uniref:FAD-dependent monooxygenase n=1 Tax=Streptomyces sp. WMMB 714 TaxID=1286822 RepID=UPI0005F86BBB|nr:FAD-dependent monooxygenase [Streptomyces sp. WMMB 714]SCK53044.1 2-polyprenyl-6-methoxyphenol hydroxylase [Streptomyces sp. WMMB 714]
MRILIIGGGIAGSAAALALDKAGIAATVHEAHPDEGADIGAFLTLASNGMLALAQFDAAEAVSRVGFDLTTMRITGDTGTVVSTVPLGEAEDPLRRYRCLRRAELAAALRAEAVRRGIAVEHGKRFVSAEEDEEGVTAVFADGSTARGDLLLGADGMRSAVRSLTDPDAAAPRYAGQRVFYGYTTDAAPPSEPGRIDMLRGSTAAMGYAVSPQGETYWFARVSGDELSRAEIDGTTPTQWRDHLLPMLRPDATAAAEIVAATGEHLMVTNASDLSTVTRWRTTRMLLIGDAAHAASPATGQGASMALEDAVVLAKSLRDAPSTEAALETYEQLRRPRVERNIVTSARLTTRKAPNRLRRTVRNYRARFQKPGTGPSPSQADDLLTAQLDWESPLPVPAPSGN